MKKSEDFDPQADPIVRVQVSRLRQLLERYYQGPGLLDQLRIELVKGSYQPRFHFYPQDSLLLNNTESTGQSLQGPRLAIAPLHCLEDEVNLQAFGRGLTEELITRLTGYHQLQVLAGHTVESYLLSSRPLERLQGELAVDYLLEGSVQGDGSRVRVNVRLTDLHSGTHCWGQIYDISPEPVRLLDAQNDIAARLVGILAQPYGVIYRLEKRRSLTAPSAYSALLSYLLYNETFDAQTHAGAREALEAVMGRKTDCPDIPAALSLVYAGEEIFAFNPRSEALPALDRALAAVGQALALDPLHPMANYALALIHFYRRELEAFFALADRLLEQFPDRAEVLAILGQHLALAGQWQRGLGLMDRAKLLNPFFPGWYHFPYVLDLYRRGRYREALYLARQINLPSFFWDPLVIAMVAAALGEVEVAGQAARRLQLLLPFSPQDFPTLLGHFIIDPALVERCCRDLGRAGAGL